MGGGGGGAALYAFVDGERKNPNFNSTCCACKQLQEHLACVISTFVAGRVSSCFATGFTFFSKNVQDSSLFPITRT